MQDRLTPNHWIEHGLKTLAREGHNALKVGPMADKLNVSRGSFYWHFRDIGDFRTQLLQRWQARSTDEIIQDLDAREGDPRRFKELIQRGFRGRRSLDRAIRSWAAHDKAVAALVAAVDARRIARMTKLLVEAGVDREWADQRAAFIYWAYLGQPAVMDQRHAALPPNALAELAGLFEAVRPQRSREARRRS